MRWRPSSWASARTEALIAPFDALYATTLEKPRIDEIDDIRVIELSPALTSLRAKPLHSASPEKKLASSTARARSRLRIFSGVTS